VKINDKHFEVIRQMMRKVRVQDPGDTLFLEDQLFILKILSFKMINYMV
jgi:DNA-directed RNA polymerase subunit beta'